MKLLLKNSPGFKGLFAGILGCAILVQPAFAAGTSSLSFYDCNGEYKESLDLDGTERVDVTLKFKSKEEAKSSYLVALNNGIAEEGESASKKNGKVVNNEKTFLDVTAGSYKVCTASGAGYISSSPALREGAFLRTASAVGAAGGMALALGLSNSGSSSSGSERSNSEFVQPETLADNVNSESRRPSNIFSTDMTEEEKKKCDLKNPLSLAATGCRNKEKPPALSSFK